MTYNMTPARRAALRKAQLISARKRRKHGALRTIARTTRQRAEAAYRQGQLNHYQARKQHALEGQKVQQTLERHKVERKALGIENRRKKLRRGALKVGKTAATAGLTLGAATAVGYTAYGMTSNYRQVNAANRHLKSMGYGATTKIRSTRIHGTKIKALPRGR